MDIVYLHNKTEYITTVANWIYNEFVKDINKSVTIEKVIEFFSHSKENEFPITLIAINDNKCVGTVSIFENDLKTQNELSPWLASLYVHPEYRGQKIAQNLINRVIEIVNSMGYKKVYLRTEHTSEYYKRLGWEFVYRTTDQLGQKTEVYTKVIS